MPFPKKLNKTIHYAPLRAAMWILAFRGEGAGESGKDEEESGRISISRS